jgi:hypothetical protein
MSKDLEKYLQKQREAMDVESPDDALIWEGIRKDLHQAEVRSERKRMWIRLRNMAAVLIILVSVGYMVFDLIGEGRMGKELSLADLDQELGSREKEYRSKVALKYEEAQTYNYVDDVIIAELLEEIQKLDTIYEETLEDLNELGYDEQVIQTIFDTYEKKIYLLELIILENNKIKNHENKENLFL